MKTEPERSCIVTREAKAKEALLRFVLSPEGVLTPDMGNKLPGRGMYVSVSKLVLIEALHKKAFNRAAGAPVTVPEGLLALVEAQLLRRVSDALSLARKAGQVITGFEKVEKALLSGKVVAMVHASDAGEDGVKKFRRFTKKRPDEDAFDDEGELLETPSDAADLWENEEEKELIPTFRELPREVISAVLGRENAVHVAIIQGPAAKFFIAEARRFALFLQ